MPFIKLELIEKLFTQAQKKEILGRLLGSHSAVGNESLADTDNNEDIDEETPAIYGHHCSPDVAAGLQLNEAEDQQPA